MLQLCSLRSRGRIFRGKFTSFKPDVIFNFDFFSKVQLLRIKRKKRIELRSCFLHLLEKIKTLRQPLPLVGDVALWLFFFFFFGAFFTRDNVLPAARRLP